MDVIGQVVWAVAPTVSIGLIFWFVMRAILRADRNERAAQARIDAELDAREAQGTSGTADPAAV